MNKIVLAVCMLMVGLVVVFGLYLFLQGARRIQLAAASVKWPTTAGKVVSSETTRDASTYRRHSTVTFNTEVVIRYTVRGQDYNTDVLHFGQTLGSSDKSDASLQRLRFPAGKDVSVSYDPANPATGVMNPGVHAEAFWLPGAGLAFLLPAALCMFLLPGMFRSTVAGDQAFANYVQTEIDQRQRPEIDQRQRPEIDQRRLDLPPPRRSPDKVMTVAAAAFGAVFCCLGILALTAGLQRAWRGGASQSWPIVPGVVIQTGTDEPDDSTDSAYPARLIYKYDVKGITHFNNLRSFAEVESDQRYKTGDHVNVSYFPTDPDVSVIEPGNASASLWLPGIGTLMLLMSLAAFYWVVPAVGKPV